MISWLLSTMGVASTILGLLLWRSYKKNIELKLQLAELKRTIDLLYDRLVAQQKLSNEYAQKLTRLTHGQFNYIELPQTAAKNPN